MFPAQGKCRSEKERNKQAAAKSSRMSLRARNVLSFRLYFRYSSESPKTSDDQKCPQLIQNAKIDPTATEPQGLCRSCGGCGRQPCCGCKSHFFQRAVKKSVLCYSGYTFICTYLAHSEEEVRRRDGREQTDSWQHVAAGLERNQVN